ncbi:hypothetical protein G3M48_005493 [Beauveria asiatica]|uniref:Uncharacterized protein n=1 Tax=Beauveria asiatica TaxID=1069075 RepID=A0AAW0RRM8_9HYPO
MVLIITGTQNALDKIWIAQQRWNEDNRLPARAHCANAYLVFARAREGLNLWEFALRYWDRCRGLYPEGWSRNMEGRLQACRVLSSMSKEILRTFAPVDSSRAWYRVVFTVFSCCFARLSRRWIH